MTTNISPEQHPAPKPYKDPDPLVKKQSDADADAEAVALMFELGITASDGLNGWTKYTDRNGKSFQMTDGMHEGGANHKLLDFGPRTDNSSFSRSNSMGLFMDYSGTPSYGKIQNILAGYAARRFKGLSGYISPIQDKAHVDPHAVKTPAVDPYAGKTPAVKVKELDQPDRKKA